MPIKSFRGKMQENQIDTISLSTNTGSIGYKINKLQLMPVDTGGIVNTSNEAAILIYSIKSSADDQAALGNASVDFSDNTLLGVGYFLRDQGVVSINSKTVIFDNMTFNQDVFIVYKDSQNNTIGMNYYLELEQVKLDLNENTVATLKDIRNITLGNKTI